MTRDFWFMCGQGCFSDKMRVSEGKLTKDKHLYNCLQRTQSHLLKKKGLAVKLLEVAATNHFYARIFVSHSFNKKKRREGRERIGGENQREKEKVSVEFRLLDLGFRKKFFHHIIFFAPPE